MKIKESAENYLETIYILHLKNPNVRAIDIACELDYSKPSVSIAMKHLRENGYVEIDALGHITLSESGGEIARRMFERHTLISDYLISIGVSPQVALEDACRIEHVISAESFDALKNHFKSVDSGGSADI